jgi:hypothetical protein
MMRIVLSCVGWVTRAVAFCLGLAAMFALVVVSAILVAAMAMAIAVPSPKLLAVDGYATHGCGPGTQ